MLGLNSQKKVRMLIRRYPARTLSSYPTYPGTCVQRPKKPVPGTGNARHPTTPAQTGSKVVLTPQRVDLSDKIANRVHSNWF